MPHAVEGTVMVEVKLGQRIILIISWLGKDMKKFVLYLTHNNCNVV